MNTETGEDNDFKKNFKFAEDFERHSKEFFLLQVPMQILKELTENNNLSIISKSGSDIAKLVSSDDTYKLKKFDYPNSFFLNEREGEDYQVRSFSKTLYQIEKQPTNKEALFQYLKRNQVLESHFEESQKDQEISERGLKFDLKSAAILKRGHDMTALVNDFFISEKNLQNFVKEVSGIVVGNTLIFIEIEIYLKIIRQLLSHLSSPDVQQSYNNVSLEYIETLFPEVSPLILKNALNLFATPNEDMEGFKISYENIIKFIMTELQQAKQDYFMDDFFDFLQKMIAVYIPESMESSTPSEERALITYKTRNKYFMVIDNNQYNLSTPIDLTKIAVVSQDPYFASFEPKERVSFLFDKKKNFFPSEFRDFLQILKLPKKEEDDLVLSSCRSINISIHKKHKEVFQELYPAENLSADKLCPDNFSCKVYNYKKK